MTGAVHAIDRAFARAGLVLSRFGRPIRDGLIIIGLGRAAYYFFVQDIQPWTFVGVDARAYWRVDLAHPYVHSGVGDVSSYLYSPAFAQVLAPFGALPFNVFYAIWAAVSLAILVWLVRPWPWALLILALPIIFELCVGNVNYLLAAAIVLSFRAPPLWALPVLTKITIGVGALWFALRREWRSLALAMGSTALIVAVSFVISPTAWMDWIAFLRASSGENDQLPLRIGIALLLLATGALTGRRWLVPIAAWIAQPNVIINSWVILLAVIRLRGPEEKDASTPADAG